MVDIAFIRAALCPEYYTAKMPSPGYSPCMTIQSSTNYTLSVTSSGSTVVVFNPGNANEPFTSTTNQTWYCQNPNAFNTDVGTYTGMTSYAGPLNAISQDVAQFRVLSCSLAFVPTLSENNAQGCVSLCQYTNYNELFINSNLPDS